MKFAKKWFFLLTLSPPLMFPKLKSQILIITVLQPSQPFKLLWKFSHRYHFNWHSFVIKIQYVFFFGAWKLFLLFMFDSMSFFLWLIFRRLFLVHELTVTSKAYLNPSIHSLGTTNNFYFHLLSIKFSVFLVSKVFFRISLSLVNEGGKFSFLRKNYRSNLRKMCNL